MQLGVIIEKGPQNWQIIQQENGGADISLSGRWVRLKIDGEVKVYVRVVKEDTGENIIPWTECRYLANNRWEIVIKNVPVGGLYRIETCLNNSGCSWFMEWARRGDMIHHIGVGDLYVIAGQSNAVGYGKDPIYDPPQMGVHLLKNSGIWDIASHPLGDSTNTTHEVNRDGANTGHSPYLNFAKIVRKEINIPIGLIQTALGGSPLDMWNPDESGVLYKNMMDIIKSSGGKVRGILWYQGCSDTTKDECNTYYDRFENLVTHVRADLNDYTLPFFTVQLNRCTTPCENNDENYCWGKVREAQRQAAKNIPYVYIVPAIDLKLSDAIHNSSCANMMLGERISRAVLNEIYGKVYFYKSPDIVFASVISANEVVLEFDNVKGKLYLFEIEADKLPFEVIDERGKVEIISYRVKNANKVILKLQRQFEGESRVHGAYEKNPTYFVPIDTQRRMPMLSFYDVKIHV